MTQTDLEVRVDELTRQVEFCNDMVILLFLGFYIVVLSALLCCYLFTRNRLNREASETPPPPPKITVINSVPQGLEQLLSRLIDRIDAQAVPVVASKVDVPVVVAPVAPVEPVEPVEPVRDYERVLVDIVAQA